MEARHTATCGLQGVARPRLVPLAEHRPNVRTDLVDRREITKHVLVVGLLLTAAAVLFWASYFGPLS